jgi:LmbE family N-acetylglucosaminyl deacetylase
MKQVTVLSPHRDDAAFSLGLALSAWSGAPVHITVLNFFTVSAYAPQVSETSIERITAIREQEDVAVLRTVNPAIVNESLGMADAPIRLHIPLNQITHPDASARVTDHDISSLAVQIKERTSGHLVLAPLSLGDHVDHIAVHRAALSAVDRASLGFYEDLPYATWTPPSNLESRLKLLSNCQGFQLCPEFVRSADAVERKYQIVRGYASQVDEAAARVIAEFARTYESGAERIWTPESSEEWQELLLLARD